MLQSICHGLPASLCSPSLFIFALSFCPLCVLVGHTFVLRWAGPSGFLLRWWSSPVCNLLIWLLLKQSSDLQPTLDSPTTRVSGIGCVTYLSEVLLDEIAAFSPVRGGGSGERVRCCGLLLLVHHHYVWVECKVPQKLSPVVPSAVSPVGRWVLLIHMRHRWPCALPLSVCQSSWSATCLWGTFAQLAPWVLSAVVHPCLCIHVFLSCSSASKS